MFRLVLVAKAKTVAPAMADGEAVALSVDPSDGGVRVHLENGSTVGGGVQYTEGDVDASVTGTAVMWEDTSDTLRVASATKPLPVNIISGGGSGSNAAASATGSAVPASADYTGVNVGGTLRGAVGVDLDTGAGTEFALSISLRKAASGGSVELGTLADPIRTDPTGTTTQPVSGTVTANVGTTNGLALDATLTGGTQKSKLVDTGGTNVASVSAGGALKVDNSAVTQPVSAASLPLPTGAATETTLDTRSGSLTEAAPATDTASSGLNGRLQRIAQRLTTSLAIWPTTVDTNSGSKSASTLRVVLATDQPALTNKLLVTPDSVALPANQSTNVAQVAGTTTDTNSGVKSAGTLRVVLATDQPQLTNKLLVTPDANSAVNVAQINGVTPLMGAGNTGTGSPRVTIATDQVVIPVSDLPVASGGLSKFHLVSVSTSGDVNNIKASAGQVYCIVAFNLNASPRYLKFHNSASTPTAGSGVTDTFMIPGNSTEGRGITINIDKGIAFSTGIGISLVTGIADNNSTAVAASEIVLQVYYK